MEDATSVSTIAVTAAVGAVVLLFILLCNIGRKAQSEKGIKFAPSFVSNRISAQTFSANLYVIATLTYLHFSWADLELPKQLTSTSCTHFGQLLTTLLEYAVRET